METPQILQQLNGRQSRLAQMLPRIKQAKEVMRTIQNPQLAMNQFMQNPKVLNAIQQYGSVDGAINALCQQQGIPVQELMDALK